MWQLKSGLPSVQAPISDFVKSLCSGGNLTQLSKQWPGVAQSGLPCSTGQARLENGSDVGEWMVCQVLGSGKGIDHILQQGTAAGGSKMIPWVGVAAKLPTGAGGSIKLPGRAFCFLPLPVHTGLPVHINGFFELSSNRRDIW